MENLRGEFKQNEEVLLDGYAKVKVVKQTPHNLFTTVYVTDTVGKISTQWDVMTYRLTKIK